MGEPVTAATLVADALEDELRAAGTPERAEGERAYLKSDLEHYGTPLAAIRAAVKGLRRAHPDLDHVALDLAEQLWTRPVFERRMAATKVLELCAAALRPEDLARVEALIRDSHTWALVDALATDSVAMVVARSPHDETVDRTLRRWAADDDFWVRRSALLAHLRTVRRRGSFEGWERFAEFADAMLDEREFFVRKAIGWVLREGGKERPDLVAAWVRPRVPRVSGVTLREAVRYLPEPDRDELLDAYQARRTTGRSRARR